MSTGQPAIDYWIRQRDEARAEVERLRRDISSLADSFAARGITAPGRGQPPLVGAAYIKASVDLRALLDKAAR